MRIDIPSSVIVINNAFRGCKNMKNINVDGDNIKYSSIEGVLFDKNKTILLQYPIGKDTVEYKVPDGVKTIESFAFADCTKLTSVNISDSVKTIGDSAFYQCVMFKNIKLGQNLEKIGEEAFEECYELVHISIPDSVTYIGWGAFSYCLKLSSIQIGRNMAEIANNAFYRCSELTDVYYNGTVKDWRNKVTVGTKNEFVLEATFHYILDFKPTQLVEKLEIVNIPDKNEYLMGEELNLTGLVVEVVYYDGTRERLEGDYEVSEIDYGMIGMQTMTVTYRGICATFDVNVVADTSKVVDSGTCGLNLTWTLYQNGLLMISGVGEMEEYISYHDVPWYDSVYPINNVIIGADVTSLSKYAFYNCFSLINIYVDEKNENYCSVEGVLFDKNKTILVKYPIGKSDTSYTIPHGVVAIDDNAFRFEGSLIYVEIPNGVTIIEEAAFVNCYNLTSVDIPGTLSQISDAAFGNCECLTDIYYNGTKNEWDGKVNVGEYNEPLLDATFHFYNSSNFPFTKTTVYNDGKEFDVKLNNVERGKTVVLALYNDGQLVDIKKGIYEGENLTFTTTCEYTNAKVMVWNQLDSLIPVCREEELK